MEHEVCELNSALALEVPERKPRERHRAGLAAVVVGHAGAPGRGHQAVICHIEGVEDALEVVDRGIRVDVLEDGIRLREELGFVRRVVVGVGATKRRKWSFGRPSRFIRM